MVHRNKGETDRIKAMATELKRVHGWSLKKPRTGYSGSTLHGHPAKVMGETIGWRCLWLLPAWLPKTRYAWDDVDCIETSFPSFHSKLLIY